MIGGKIGYHAGAAGTVALAPGEKVLAIFALGDTGGGTLAIDGGDDIPIPEGFPFFDRLDGGGEGWVGVSLVFTDTVSYFVKTKKPHPAP